MSKASEEELSTLHGQIARTLTQVIKVSDNPEAAQPSAAHIMAAITFCKNNNITADPASNTALKELTDQLANRRASRKLTREDISKVADQLDRDLGLSML